MKPVTVVKLTDPAMLRSPELRALSKDPTLLTARTHIYNLLVNDEQQYKLQVVHWRKDNRAFIKFYPALVDAGILIL